MMPTHRDPSSAFIIRSDHTPLAMAKREAGFTLIEMLVVMGIVILSLGFMAPNLMEAYQNRRINDSGRLLTKKLNEARNSAVTQKRVWYVAFTKRGLWLYKTQANVQGHQGAGKWQDELFEFEPAAGIVPFVHMDLPMAGDLKASELPLEVTDTSDGSSPLDSDDILLRFNADGTIDFLRNKDISSKQFRDGENADIVLRQSGTDDRIGLIDIRPTGRVQFKLQFIDFEDEDSFR